MRASGYLTLRGCLGRAWQACTWKSSGDAVRSEKMGHSLQLLDRTVKNCSRARTSDSTGHGARGEGRSNCSTAGQSLGCGQSHLLHSHCTVQYGPCPTACYYTCEPGMSTRRAANIFSPPPLLFSLPRHPPFIHPLPLLSPDTSILLLPTRHLLFS